MKQKISPGVAAVIIVVVAVLAAGLFYKLNFAGPPPAPPIPMKVSGTSTPAPMSGPATPGAQIPGMPGAQKGGSGGAPTPGGGMMSPTLPGGPGGPGPGGTGPAPGGGMMAPTLPGGPPR